MEEKVEGVIIEKLEKAGPQDLQLARHNSFRTPRHFRN